VRKTSNTTRLKKLGVEIVYGDLTDCKSLQNAAKDVDVVYHLGAYYTFHGVWEKYYTVNVEGTKNLITACENVDQFIYCSSTEAVGPVNTIPADETHSLHPVYDYGKSKVMAETIVNQKIAHGYPATIIRPVGVYGPRCIDDVSYYFLMNIAKNSIFTRFIVGSGENVIDFVFVKDLVQGFLKARNKKAIGETYFISSPCALSYNEVYTTVCRLVGRTPPSIHIPAVAAKLMIAPLQGAYKIIGKKDFMAHISTVDDTQSNRAYSWEKAHKDFNYQPEYIFEKGARITLEWYKKHGYIT
jgi:nucleoside-diphosphate-sugar epimerase